MRFYEQEALLRFIDAELKERKKQVQEEIGALPDTPIIKTPTITKDCMPHNVFMRCMKEGTAVGRGVIVVGDVKLSGKFVLPEDLTIVGDLEIKQASLGSIPNNLRVHGNMECSYCPELSRVGHRLVVTRNCTFNSCPISSIGKEWIVCHYLHMERLRISVVDLSDYYIGSLRMFSLHHLNKIEGKLVVKSMCHLQSMKTLENLPSLMYVGKGLHLSELISYWLPPLALYVGEFFNLDRCHRLKYVCRTEKLWVGDNLIIEQCAHLNAITQTGVPKIRSIHYGIANKERFFIPNSTVVGDTLKITTTQEMDLPNTMYVGRLVIDHESKLLTDGVHVANNLVHPAIWPMRETSSCLRVFGRIYGGTFQETRYSMQPENQLERRASWLRTFQFECLLLLCLIKDDPKYYRATLPMDILKCLKSIYFPCVRG